VTGVDHAGWQAEANALVAELLDPPLQDPLFEWQGPVDDGGWMTAPVVTTAAPLRPLSQVLIGNVNLDDSMYRLTAADKAQIITESKLTVRDTPAIGKIIGITDS
jgi:hypothetical protein